MKGFMALLVLYFAPYPWLRWLYLPVLALWAVSTLNFASADKLAPLALMLLFFIPVLFAGFQYRQLLQKSRFMLLPFGRLKALAALFAIAVLAALAVLPFSQSPGLVTGIFAAVTATLLLSQWLYGSRYSVLLVFAYQLPHAMSQSLWQHFAQQYWLVLLVLSLTAWLWMLAAQPQQRLCPIKKRPLSLPSFLSRGRPGYQLLLPEGSSLNGSIVVFTLLLCSLPFLCLSMLSLLLPGSWQALVKDSLLAFLLPSLPLAHRPRRSMVLRLRCLWLRLPGGREQLSAFIKPLIKRDWLISSLIITVLISLWSALAAMPLMATSIALIFTLSLNTLVQLTMLWTAQGSGSARWQSDAKTLLLLMPPLTLFLYFGSQQHWLPLWLTVYNLLLSAMIYWRLQSGFGHQDLLRVKPRRKTKWQLSRF
ncbi:hypothetical protein [Gallaecimonas mangrovi]|uniref:hypothetical protein n=1 Tax=Gallaecimonas mangrovi TaxID=2291597 RepID=UPI000E2035BF|nr:hypothetical protein [Gallaecimonas mangrovi]